MDLLAGKDRVCMSQVVTLAIPDRTARSANDIAQRTRRSLEDVLIEWIDQAAAEIPINYLPDAQILALCNSELDVELQQELSQLLADSREGMLNSASQERLDALMQLYRRGLVRKAEAVQIAVKRGLLQPLN